MKPSPRPASPRRTARALISSLTHHLGNARPGWFLAGIVAVCVLPLATALAVRHYRYTAAQDPVARQKAFTAEDPVGAKACDLINDWLRGGGQQPLWDAFTLGRYAGDDYVRLQAGSASGMQVACEAAGTIMYRPGIRSTSTADSRPS